MKCAIVSLALVLLPTSALANESVPVTAIANPQAVSSGSVTNQAVQVMNGPYTTNSFGSGVQCQGPTLNITPFITTSQSGQGPLYNTSDSDTWTFNPGLSMTVSVPLDGHAQELCREAARAVTERMRVETAKGRLDFELVRLLRCGEAVRQGIYFHPDSPYASVCADVVVANAPQVVSSSQPAAPPLVVLPPVSAQVSSPQTQSTVEVQGQ